MKVNIIDRTLLPVYFINYDDGIDIKPRLIDIPPDKAQWAIKVSREFFEVQKYLEKIYNK